MISIEVKDLSFAYQEKQVLNQLNFTVNRGDFLGIIGPNGSGKSTLLRVLAGLLAPQHGQVRINDRELSDYSIGDLAQIIAVVPEETLVTFPFTVEQLVLMGRAPYRSFLGSLTATDLKVVTEAMGETSVSSFQDHFVNELSSGERQRVFIAQALAQQPKIILLDEPTAHLDINYQTEIFDLLRNLQAKNDLTVIVVSHDLNLAALYCDKLLLLKEGQIYYQGVPDQVITTTNLKEVYNSAVTVNRNPQTQKPQISLIPKGDKTS